MKNKLILVVSVLLLVALVVPVYAAAERAPIQGAAPVVETKDYSVTADILRVRAGGSTSTTILGRVYFGETVKVIEIVDGWAKVQFGGGTAYVSARYIEEIKPVAESNTVAGGVAPRSTVEPAVPVHSVKSHASQTA